MTQHTPGPWEVDHDNNEHKQWYTAGPAHLFFRYNAPKLDQEEAEANACLIAAAPQQQATIDLLEAEKADLLAALEDALSFNEELASDLERWSKAIRLDMEHQKYLIAQAKP